MELKKQPLSDVSIQNTARVLKEVGAQVQGIVEAESRIALLDLSGTVMPNVGGKPFEHVMLVDGNDERGIDVGLMTRDGWQITRIRSHVDDNDDQGVIFSRDCVEYTVEKNGARLIALVNHFKSKGYGSQTANNANDAGKQHASPRSTSSCRRRVKRTWLCSATSTISPAPSRSTRS